MSFSIPAIQTTDLTAAAISTQVWADKEVISVPKLYVVNYSKLTGIAQTTWYTALDVEDIHELVLLSLAQVHDEAGGPEVSVRITIDGEVFTKTNTAFADSTQLYIYLTPPGSIGANPDLNIVSTPSKCGLQNWQGAGAEYAGDGPIGGHAVKVEYRFDDPPGTNQKFYADIVYRKADTV